MGSSGNEDEHYRMRWNDFQASVTSAFADIRDEQELFDVTLVAPGGRAVKAHKLVLSACSPLFKAMFRQNSHPQPMIFMHGVRYSMLNAILNYMYQGEVSVDQEHLDGFLAAAEGLQVRGFEQAWVNKKESFSNLEITKSPPPHLAKKKQRLGSASEDGGGGSGHHGLKSNVKTEPGTLIVTPDFPGGASCSTGESDDDGAGGGSSSGGRSAHLHVTRGLGKVGDYYNHLHQGGFNTPHTGRGRRPSSVIDYSSKEGVSYHRLGGRDASDPVSTMMVALTCKGWHCPECSHTATTKGNLKAHILSGRHKVSEKSFSCQYCQRNYSTRQSLQVHISTNHRFERDQEYKQEYQQQQQQGGGNNNAGGSGNNNAGGGGHSLPPPPPPSSTPATTAPSSSAGVNVNAPSALMTTSSSSPSLAVNKSVPGGGQPSLPPVPVAAAPHYLHHAAQLAASSAVSGGQQGVVPQPLLTPQQQYMQHYIQQQQSNAAAAAFHKDGDVEVLAANYGANNM